MSNYFLLREQESRKGRSEAKDKHNMLYKKVKDGGRGELAVFFSALVHASTSFLRPLFTLTLRA